MSRVPRSLEVGAKNFFCGPESFTPDLSPILGEAPELKNYFVAAGMNSIGILTGGGVGRLIAHWVATGKPDMDVTGMNINRVHKYQCNPEYRSHRVVESLGRVYKCHYPSESLTTARNVKRSVIYDRLKARGAYFKDVSGWEGILILFSPISLFLSASSLSFSPSLLLSFLPSSLSLLSFSLNVPLSFPFPYVHSLIPASHSRLPYGYSFPFPCIQRGKGRVGKVI